jgi:Protein of unknown function (DUF3027)
VSPATRTRRPTVDAVLADAVEVARSAAEDVAGSAALVGEHAGVQVDGERLLTHLFACLSPGYAGWQWSVTLARVPRSRIATVDEAVLLPGPGALLAPAWLPWSERLRPGDLGVGDLLPATEDDVRLEQGYEATGDEDADAVALWELGLGRRRVLSAVGRDDASDRWYSGDAGPSSPIAAAAPAQCSTCGFFLPVAGALRAVFGVCANEYAPDDGRVVAVDHGCGAHSETLVSVDAARVRATPIVDEIGYDLVDSSSVDTAVEGEDDTAAELGHS